jgi:hypothetical protein
MINLAIAARGAALSLALLAGVTARARTQGVPLISLEVTGGAGPHTLRTSHQYYNEGNANLLRVATTVRLWTPAMIAPVLSLDYHADCIYACGEKLSCRVAPNGGCFESFASPDGPAVALGVAATWQRAVTGTLAAGRGWFPHRAAYLDANVALAPFSHVGVVVDARHIMMNDDRGDRVWMFPLSFGLRFF